VDRSRTYAYSNNDRFEQLRFSLEAKEHSPQIVHLGFRSSRSTRLLVVAFGGSPGMADFIDDVVAA